MERINWREYIVADNRIVGGKPIIKGTRLSVDFLLGRLANGWTEQQILSEYEQLTPKDLQALFAYLQECIQDGLLGEVSWKRSA